MPVYEHDQQKESPWAILDPSLKQPIFFPWNSSSESSNKPTYLDFPLALLHSQQIQEKGSETETISDPGVEEEEVPSLEDYLKELKEIETELAYHRNSIYSEKLEALQDELLSIENETHKKFLKQDKKLAKKRDKEIQAKEAMYEYEIESIDKQVEHEKLKILEDVEQKAGFARRVLTSEGSLYNGITPNKKKRKEKSPSTTHSDTDDGAVTDTEQQEQTGFKRIHLRKKIGKLQAISDRQRAVKSNKKNIEDALNTINQNDLDNDMLMIKKGITSADNNQE